MSSTMPSSTDDAAASREADLVREANLVDVLHHVLGGGAGPPPVAIRLVETCTADQANTVTRPW